jgi:hypothetical protein
VGRPLFLHAAYWQLGISPKRFCEEIFATAGGLWLIVEVVSYFIPNKVQELRAYWWIFFLIGFIVALFRSRPLLRTSYNLEGRDILFELVVRDIWSMQGDVVISATTTFETDDRLIASDSLQGQFTEKYYTSAEHLSHDIRTQLDSSNGVAIDRGSLQLMEYPVGTVVRVCTQTRSAYLLALTKLNGYGTASASIEDLRVALPRLWEYISFRGDFGRLLVPMIGGGRARISISSDILVQELILSAIAAASSSRFCEKLTIVVSPKDFINRRVDIIEIADFLRLHCKFTQYRAASADRSGSGLGMRPI